MQNDEWLEMEIAGMEITQNSGRCARARPVQNVDKIGKKKAGDFSPTSFNYHQAVQEEQWFQLPGRKRLPYQQQE